MIRSTLTAAVAVALCASSLFAADIVTRKSDGKKVSGAISDMSKNDLTVKKGTGDPEVIQANDVAAIEWDGGGPKLRLAYTDEAADKFETAITRYTEAKSEAKSPNEFLKGEFDYVIARATAELALRDPSKQASAIQLLQAAQKSRPDHFRYYESVSMLGRVQLAAGDFAGARTTFEQLAKAPWSDYKLAAKIASGRILVAEGKLDDAAKEFEAAASSATESAADQTRKYEAMLGQARALIAQKKYEDSLKILDLVADKGPADDPLQAEAHVLQGNSLQQLGQIKPAILAYLYVDLIFPREAEYHAEALYNLVKTCKEVQDQRRSSEAESRLVQSYPNSAWRKKLASE